MSEEENITLHTVEITESGVAQAMLNGFIASEIRLGRSFVRIRAEGDEETADGVTYGEDLAWGLYGKDYTFEDRSKRPNERLKFARLMAAPRNPELINKIQRASRYKPWKPTNPEIWAQIFEGGPGEIMSTSPENLQLTNSTTGETAHIVTELTATAGGIVILPDANLIYVPQEFDALGLKDTFQKMTQFLEAQEDNSVTPELIATLYRMLENGINKKFKTHKEELAEEFSKRTGIRSLPELIHKGYGLEPTVFAILLARTLEELKNRGLIKANRIKLHEGQFGVHKISKKGKSIIATRSVEIQAGDTFFVILPPYTYNNPRILEIDEPIRDLASRLKFLYSGYHNRQIPPFKFYSFQRSN